MKQEEIVTALSAHLRRQGVAADRADLVAFAADPGELPDGDPEVEALARRFQNWQQRTDRARDRRRAKAWAEGACLAGVGTVIVGIGALGVLAPIIMEPTWAADVTTATVAWFVVTGGITAFGAVLILLGIASGVRTSRRVAAEAVADGD